MSGMEDQLGAILGDPEMMQKIQALAQSMGQSQSTGQPEKIAKLEKAMRSAKLAQQTSGLLESGALKNLTGG